MTDKTPALPEPVARTWETFCDTSYYDMWCVRPVGEREFGVGFHLMNQREAATLAITLTALDAQAQAAKADATKARRHRDISRKDADEQEARATTAEAALEGARKVIEEIADPNKLPSHGDPTVIRDHAAQWLSALQEGE